jgi:hypothetical protein
MVFFVSFGYESQAYAFTASKSPLLSVCSTQARITNLACSICLNHPMQQSGPNVKNGLHVKGEWIVLCVMKYYYIFSTEKCEHRERGRFNLRKYVMWESWRSCSGTYFGQLSSSCQWQLFFQHCSMLICHPLSLPPKTALAAHHRNLDFKSLGRRTVSDPALGCQCINEIRLLN